MGPLRALLLIALTLAGTVPAGMMRVSGGDGLRLVLCTPDGVQEVWLAEDGTVLPDGGPTGDDPSRHGAPHCVQVALFAPDERPVRLAPCRLRLCPPGPAPAAHQVVPRPAPSRPQLSRAPPRLA
jgi:hypothetical protein